jgi:ABC-2 type transport system permease protein
MMKDIMWLVMNTLSVTFRKKKNIIMYLCMPLIGIFISLLAYGDETKMVLHVGIVNDDPSYVTADTIHFLEGLDNLKLKKIHENDVQTNIASGNLDSVITFEKGFSDSVLKGNPNHIQLTSVKGAEVTAFVKSYLTQYIQNISSISKAADGDMALFKKLYNQYQTANFKVTNHDLKDTSKNIGMTNQTIGFLIMIMLMSAGNLSEIILSEKENRTFYRLLSTPINARKYILSNVIVNLIVMTIQVLITLTAMTTIFHININIPIWDAAVVMFLFSLISVGISLVTTAFSKNRSSAGALQNLVVMPTVMLSGCFWPVEIMPESLKKISNFLPQRWTLDTLTKLQEGNSLSGLYLHLIILVTFAIAFFLIAIFKFSKNNTTQNFV